MPERRRFEVRVAATARRDLVEILKWSRREFGEAAARRYEALIAQALRDISNDPECLGSRERAEILVEGARTYHLEFSRKTAGRSSGLNASVREPRHFLLYRRRGNVIEVARILHDSRDLMRHLPEGYQRGAQ